MFVLLHVGLHIFLTFDLPGATAFSFSFFGEGRGGIFLDDVSCSGSESMLINCPHRGIGVHNCDHSDDAGVACVGMMLYIYTIVMLKDCD